MTVSISKLMAESGVSFGTSGVRGLVKEMTDKVCFAYVLGFLKYIEQSHPSSDRRVAIAGDLRNSTDRIMNACAAACVSAGYKPVNLGKIPSPAAALYGLEQAIPSIMVTGSHIPEDRNGIKFNTPKGEILKQDELAIKSQQVAIDDALFAGGDLKKILLPESVDVAKERYLQRYLSLFSTPPLTGMRVGVYQHSAVGRDIVAELLEQLGAEVSCLGRSDLFVSVDTEAIRPEDVELAANWSKEFNLDCIVSTDGDSDRPLVSDENGTWLRGDVIGIVTAQFLNAATVVTPVNSNSALEKCGLFDQTVRTRIGSPYVIQGMMDADSSGCVVGYEANGGFLQQTETTIDGKSLAPLPTRDAIIVMLAVMTSSQRTNRTISALMSGLPERYTASNRIKGLATETSKAWLAELSEQFEHGNMNALAQLFPELAQVISFDQTDGLRLTLEDQNIVHFRPSGNAPELRCYSESGSADEAQKLNDYCLQNLTNILVN